MTTRPNIKQTQTGSFLVPTGTPILHNTKYQGNGREVGINNFNAPVTDLRVLECHFRGKWNWLKVPPRNYVKWLLRLYGMKGMTVINSLFEKVGIEHGIYANLEGGTFLFQNCTFRRITSQGLQFVWRISEGGVIHPRPESQHETKTIKVIDCMFHSVGRNNWAYQAGTARPAAAISAHYCGSDTHVLVEGTELHSQTRPFTFSASPPNAQSFGAIMVEHAKSATIRDTLVNYAQPSDRPVVQLHDIQTVDIDGLHLPQGGKVSVMTDNLRVRNCTGEGRLLWNGTEYALTGLVIGR